MMQLIHRARRGAAALLAIAALAACENEIPTASGPGLFPGEITPTTLVQEFTGDDFIVNEEVFAGFGDPRLSPFLLLAHQFDGAFDAHPIVRFSTLPDSVSYTLDDLPRRHEIASFAGGRLLVPVDSLASTPRQSTRLELFEIAQPWDSATVSWEYAVNSAEEQVAWTTPGGTRGRFLDEEFWLPGNETQQDTVVLTLDSLTVHQISTGEHPGFLLVTDRPGTRLKLSGMTLAVDARPASEADTLIELRTMEAVQQFLYTDEPVAGDDALVTGGLRGDRSLFTLDLAQEVEACPEDGGACRIVPLRDVTVNRAQLVLHPLEVPLGHRPLAVPTVQLRTVAEPELGRFAPLGSVIATDTISPSAFAPGTDREFALDISNTVLQRLAAQRAAIRRGEAFDTRITFALMTTYQVPDLGLLYFRSSPRLRVVYTLPLDPSLP